MSLLPQLVSLIVLSSCLVITFLVVYENILDRPGFRAVEADAPDKYASLFKLLVGGGKEAADFLNAYLPVHLRCILFVPVLSRPFSRPCAYGRTPHARFCS
ncbi:hypothetical protein [Bacteroides ovatus]|uniref:hypothetical protein n=1 Tax=Bacteroides ovatus TaxID=28116 RepID=UPI0020A7EE13|nr:hypothetical protein [Bacteroides ovatus]